VAASGLLIRSFVLLSNVDPGFDASRVLTVATMLPPNKYRDGAQGNTFYDEVLGKLNAMPGVRAAGLTTSLPLTNFNQLRTFSVEDQPDKPMEQLPPVTVEDISPRYFETLRVPLLAGRFFDEHDTKSQTHAVIANQAFVQKYFGKQGAVGKRMRFGGGPGVQMPWETIVGVV